MRLARLIGLGLLLCVACGDDDTSEDASAGDGGSEAGTRAAGKGGSGAAGKSAGRGGSSAGTGGSADDADAGSSLDRPGSLPRPPEGGLPSDLEPPR